ncbi:amino acid racemase [Terasakiella sp. A23]|uniref:aspartate/glutamate racemase family protein n=1 Tax=Terasakiella sp. FCG-A23 TaxID=3080561 RepID=UPI002955C1DD|nr:amino acid racemase [Terasakiella sp. A23]MDV7341213.1 amino acid racemase [Terasakiella sp. A23]
MMHDVIGILGGMGPLATVDFMKKITNATPAKKDQDHLPIVAYSVPQIPDRSTSILSGNDAPLQEMQQGIKALESMGAKCIVIPCNTAHYWYDRLCQKEDTQLLHIADTVVHALQDQKLNHCNVGILATNGTIKAHIYQNRLKEAGYHCIVPDETVQEKLVLAGIHAVKQGDLMLGKSLLSQAAEKLKDQGCKAIILGCTEIPIVLQQTEAPSGTVLLDATNELAKGTVKWYLDHKETLNHTIN